MSAVNICAITGWESTGRYLMGDIVDMSGKLKTKYIDLQLAKAIAQKAKCRSRGEYFKWYDDHKPNNIPKHPDRVYNDWVSWNDFLGTTNTFTPNKKVYLPYWDAVRIAQKLAQQYNLKTSDAWLRYGRNNELPENIPLRPDQYYEEWKERGWKTWLGTDVQSRIETAKQQIPVFAILVSRLEPQNIVTVVQAQSADDLKQFVLDNQEVGYKLLKAYVWEAKMQNIVEKIFESFAFEKGHNQWLVPNLNSLLFELDSIMEWYK